MNEPAGINTENDRNNWWYEIRYDMVLEMIWYDIRDEKWKFDINRVATKLSALSWGKIDKYEYLKGKDISPMKQHKLTHDAKFCIPNLVGHLKSKLKLFKDWWENKSNQYSFLDVVRFYLSILLDQKTNWIIKSPTD